MGELEPDGSNAMKLEIIITDDNGSVRKRTSEGTLADLYTDITTLQAEFEARLEAAEAPQKMNIADDLAKIMGADVAARVDARIEAGSEADGQEFLRAVIMGQLTMDDLPGFVARKMRGYILSEAPNMPEAILDRALTIATAALTVELKKAQR